MIDRLVHDNMMDIDEHHCDGCSHAVALGAAPASAIEAQKLNILREMGYPPVNSPKATSGMGRVSNNNDIGESPHRRLEDERAIGQLQVKTSDGPKITGH